MQSPTESHRDEAISETALIEATDPAVRMSIAKTEAHEMYNQLVYGRGFSPRKARRTINSILRRTAKKAKKGNI